MPALPSYLTPDLLADLVRRALAEDVGAGDATTNATVGAETRAHAVLVAKESGVLAGTTVAEEVFRQLDRNLAVRWGRTDGDAVTRGDHVAEIEGPARTLLTGERTALNLLQRMSGIATATRAMVDAVRPHPARILDTRKTAPGLRLLDKWAVRIGGGQNHRIGLFDMILIKENHIVAAGGIRPALQAVNDWKASNRPIPVEIETQTLDEVREVLEVGGVDYILLDNMVRVENGQVDVSMLRQAVQVVGGRCKTEASGNVTLETVPDIAATGVDYISSGALTHSVRALDLSLLIDLRM